MITKPRTLWPSRLRLGAMIAALLMLLLSCSSNKYTGLDSVYHLGWEGENLLWASGYVKGIATTRVARYNVLDKRVILYDMEFKKLLNTRDGSIWTINSGVRRFDGNVWHDHEIQDGLTEGPYNSLLESRDGAIWVGGGGLNRYDPQAKTWQVVIPRLPDVCASSDCMEIEIGTIYALLQTKDGAIWAGTTQGVFRFEGAIAQQWTVADGLSHNSVMALLETHDGTIWAGTARGVSRKQGQKWNSWPDLSNVLAPNHSEIRQIMETDDKAIWATTHDQLVRWDGMAWASVSFCNYEANLLKASDGTLWVSSNGYGICKWDGKKWQNYTTVQGLSDNSVLSITQNPNGTLWASSLKGIDRFDPKTDRWQPFR